MNWWPHKTEVWPPKCFQSTSRCTNIFHHCFRITNCWRMVNWRLLILNGLTMEASMKATYLLQRLRQQQRPRPPIIQMWKWSGVRVHHPVVNVVHLQPQRRPPRPAALASCVRVITKWRTAATNLFSSSASTQSWLRTGLPITKIWPPPTPRRRRMLWKSQSLSATNLVIKFFKLN